MIFILGLPRSRTAWLTEFLKTDKCKTSHEESIRHSSLESLHQSGFDVICDMNKLTEEVKASPLDNLQMLYRKDG